VTSELWPSGELICSKSFFSKVVSAKVDHYSDPTTIMYCPDLMVLIYFGILGLRPSSFLILAFHFIDRTINMTPKIFLRSDESCPLRNICGLHFPSTLLDPTISILFEVFLGLDDSCPLRDFDLRVILLILNPFLLKRSASKLTTVDLTVPLFYSRSMNNT
jgi:hypothetical protein